MGICRGSDKCAILKLCNGFMQSMKFSMKVQPGASAWCFSDTDQAWSLLQVLFRNDRFQWERLTNLIQLAKEGGSDLDLSDTFSDGARLVLTDPQLRRQLILALTEDNRLHLDVCACLPSLNIYHVISISYHGALYMYHFVLVSYPYL